MSLLVPFCDRRTKLATAVIPRECGEERFCEYHWRTRMRPLTKEDGTVKAKWKQKAIRRVRGQSNG